MSFEDITDRSDESLENEGEPEGISSIVEDVKDDLESVVFEDEATIVDVMRQYHFIRKGSVDEMYKNITSVYSIEADGLDYQPATGESPKLVLEADIRTRDQGRWSLRLFRVLNTANEVRFEYILNAVTEG